MQLLDIIQFLIKNPEVLEHLRNGTASLLGVGQEEVKAILQVFNGQNIL
ncbi:MAG: competence pheromone ComX, partial [Bacillales bacterium]